MNTTLARDRWKKNAKSTKKSCEKPLLTLGPFGEESGAACVFGTFGQQCRCDEAASVIQLPDDAS